MSQIATTVHKEPIFVVVDSVEEMPDGSSTLTLHLDDAALQEVAKIGVEFILYCAAAGTDLQDALDEILRKGQA